MRAKISLTAAVLLLATSLAACGGGGGGNDETGAVERTARSVTIDRKAACERLTTTALTAYAGKGPKALSVCKRKAAKANLPKDTKVEVLTISGGRASVGYHTSDGVTGAMQLKQVNGRWLMDRVAVILP